MIDIHAHVLPGLDDGPANLDEALDLVRAAVLDGVSVIVASPHMLDGIYNVSRDQVFAAVAEFSDALREHGVAATVLAGADVHAEAEVPALLRRGELVTAADRGKHLMLELPPDVVPRELDQLLFDIQLLGVRPIISHPERNRVIQEDSAELVPLVQAGCLAQVTAASVVGDFGSQVQDCARALFEHELVHFVASDMHSLRRRGPRLGAAAGYVKQWCGSETARRILEENPDALVHGGYIDAPEPATPKVRKRWFLW